ncbi:MAG: DUF1553 domain-containing protein [Verrucomicrobiota bacterium]|nr:DUF1553 domain-containing protein [Verrucomicrobiota bacterium]
MKKLFLISAALLLSGQIFAAPTPQQIEFFETKIRPILAQECYECHSAATKKKGGLVLDSRVGWQSGGESGDVIKPGDPAASLLVQTIKHEHEDLKMPKAGAKLDDKIIADFERWIREGAFDPRDTPPSKEQIEKETAWSATLARRKEWWAFLPISKTPTSKTIDDFIDAEVTKQGIPTAPQADAQTLHRRMSYILTGLPPSGNQSIDQLLASPAFGEKWARHFMDWVRYAESYGSEGDPPIPYAYQYRDYLIRAFNDDVPYPQLVKEAIAGDLLPKPRLKNGLNESAIGIAQLRMVLHGFSPVDSLDEMVTFTDNQIDTVTKAFQGLTVSCARCHNHKFDAISQADFYALYGIFTSTHPAVIDVNAPGTGDAIRAELKQLKTQIKTTLIKDWLSKLKPEKNSTAPILLPSKPAFAFHGLPHSNPGEFSITEKGLRIYPGGYFSDLISTQDRSVLITDRFKNPGGTFWFRVAGNGGVKAKYVVQNYPRTGTVHKAIELKDEKDETLAWRSLDLDFWKDDEIFLQLATAADMPAEFKSGRSWFALTDAVITKDKTPPAKPEQTHVPAHTLILAWQNNTLTDAQAEALDALVQSKKLSTKTIADFLKRYRDLEAKLPAPTRVPGVIEANAKDAPLFVRGDHKQPAEIVPRRFLDALDPTPFNTKGSGRLELAERMADMQHNPLTARVIVNRLWHHIFGRGIVATTDNFGKLGDLPTHPELLDFLAQRFIDSGGSIKDMVKLMVSSKAFQRSSQFSVLSSQLDPENKLLSHWSMRRLEAEAIRDSIVALSGKLDTTLYGESVGSGDPRRSIYVKVIRNALDPFLTTFDLPVPFSARGKRDTTNVPAQSLTLLNDSKVIDWSRSWASRSTDAKDEVRIRQMFRQAYSRDASDDEVKQSLAYLATLQQESSKQAHELAKQEAKISALYRQITAILDPARTKLQAERKLPVAPTDLPEALAEWTFDKDLSDTKGRINLELVGAARIENGALILDGKSMAKSGSLPKKLTTKTLEAWVMLDNLTQRGGGVFTVQGKDGGLFDSIVFAEKTPAHWVAGSNFFDRSELFEGPAETEVATRPVHVAVVYQPDGTISGYRDGQPYGRTYRKAPAALFEPEASQVLLGCRHGSPTGNKGLAGRIFRARLYDRALTPEDIVKTARIESTTITEADILATLTNDQRTQLTRLQAQRDLLTKTIESTRSTAAGTDPVLQAWASLAQSLINLKEFIYLR